MMKNPLSNEKNMLPSGCLLAYGRSDLRKNTMLAPGFQRVLSARCVNTPKIQKARTVLKSPAPHCSPKKSRWAGDYKSEVKS